MISIFLIENLFVGVGWAKVETGHFCDAVAFCAITTVVTLNGTSTTIAFLTYRLIKTTKTPSTRLAVAGNIFSWLFGILVASILLKEKVYGSYRGLYCCVREDSLNTFHVALVVVIFAVSISSQTFFYTSSFLKVRAHSQQTIQTRSQERGAHQSLAMAVLRRGQKMILIFYATWFLIVIDALATLLNHSTNIWTSIVAASMAKIGLMIHCLYMYRSLARSKNHNARVLPYASAIDQAQPSTLALLQRVKVAIACRE